MKTLRHLNNTGDTAIQFDDTEATAAARAEAKALFERMTKDGASVFNVEAGTNKAERVHKFEDIADEAIIVNRIVGG